MAKHLHQLGLCDLAPVTRLAVVTTSQSQLVLSLFPGIDLLGRGFEAEGFCVVRGPDLIVGMDIRGFHTVSGRFDGVIGGSPCPDFSAARRCPPTGDGLAMLEQFRRVVLEALPVWWLLENVPRVPNLLIEGYSHQRVDLNASECGLRQNRPRHFQFGHRDGHVLVLKRGEPSSDVEPCCTASEGESVGRRGFADFCELQGLPRDFELSSFTLSAKYRAVGNGVPVPMARVVAAAVRDAVPAGLVRLCDCGCGRQVDGRRRLAVAACRKRMQRRRDGDAPGVVGDRGVTVTGS